MQYDVIYRMPTAADNLSEKNHDLQGMKSLAKAREDYIEMSMQLALKFRQAVKNAKKTNAQWKKLDDDKKIKHITEFEELNAFYTRYPIVSRYMICLESFSAKAFRRFLNLQCAPISQNPNEAMSNRNLHLQAKYLQFLWEETSKKYGNHFNIADANAVYEQAYKALLEEDTEFKNKYKEIESELTINRAINNNIKMQELLNQLRFTGFNMPKTELNADQSIKEKLYEKLHNCLIKQRFSKVMDELLQKSK